MSRKFKITIIFIFLNFNTFYIFGQNKSIINLGNKREIFIDDYLIEKLDNITFKLHSPIDHGSVLNLDALWEGDFSGYSTVIKDGTLFRMYYRGERVVGDDGNSNEVTCYSESDDGVHWRKPNLGLYEVNGSLKNNIILAHFAPITHNFSPFLDSNPDAKANQRFKALGGTSETGLFALVSSDGIHWKKLQDSAVFKSGVFDSQNVSFWSESEHQYVCYFRTWSEGGFTQFRGIRSVSRTTSKDFLNWTKPVHMTFGDTPLENLYTNQTSPYYRAPHIYISIAARFMPNRQVLTDDEAKLFKVNPKYFKDCSDAILMSSRGGAAYNRKFMQSFIRPGIGLKNWVSRTNYPVLNVVQTSKNEMSIYVNKDYAQPTAHIDRYSLRIDGFVSLHSDFEDGVVTTKPFTFEGKELEVNYSTSAAGYLKIEILDNKGQPMRGFTLNEAKEMIGDEIKSLISWNGSTDVSSLAGRPVKLRIHLKDADLYSLKFN